MDKRTISSLQQEAKKLGIKGYSRLRKLELIKVIEQHHKLQEAVQDVPAMNAEEIDAETEKLVFLAEEFRKELERTEPVDEEFPHLNIKVEKWVKGENPYLNRLAEKIISVNGAKTVWLLSGDLLLLRYAFGNARFEKGYFVLGDDHYLRTTLEFFRRYEQKKRKRSPTRPLNEHTGTIGWDVPVNWPKGISEELKRQDIPLQELPYVDGGGVRFAQCSADTIEVNKALSFLSKFFDGVSPFPVGHAPGIADYEEWLEKCWNYFLKYSYLKSTVGFLLAGADGHAITVYKKSGNMMWFIDSNLKTAQRFRDEAHGIEKKYNLKVKWINGVSGQREGSCAMHSLARICMIAYYGESGVRKPLEPWAAMLAVIARRSASQQVS